jgi:predicted MPP superfamily phosphohydrolase
MRKVAESKVILLDNESTDFHGIRIGGLSSAWEKPDLAFLDRFEREDGYRVLLCHHPEVWRDYVDGRDIDLTLCGHAHGGQIRLFGQGLFAPGQGLLPRYTGGLYEGPHGNMIVSRGLANTAPPPIPRLFNPREVVTIRLY